MTSNQTRVFYLNKKTNHRFRDVCLKEIRLVDQHLEALFDAASDIPSSEPFLLKALGFSLALCPGSVPSYLT